MLDYKTITSLMSQLRMKPNYMCEICGTDTERILQLFKEEEGKLRPDGGWRPLCEACAPMVSDAQPS